MNIKNKIKIKQKPNEKVNYLMNCFKQSFLLNFHRQDKLIAHKVKKFICVLKKYTGFFIFVNSSNLFGQRLQVTLFLKIKINLGFSGSFSFKHSTSSH